MDESSGNVAGTHHQRCCHGYCSLQSEPLRRHGRHRPASRESEVKVHRGNGGNFWQGSKCKHSPTGTHKSRARAQQSVSSRVTVQGGNGTLHAWVRFSAKITLPCHDTPPTVSIPLGRWMKCHGRFKVQALTNCDAKVMSTCTATGQFKGQFKGAMEGHRRFKMRALTQSHCAHTRHTVNSAGRWMKVQGKFKMQTHITSSVVMDVAAFKVSHSAVTDKDATTLRAARARSSSI